MPLIRAMSLLLTLTLLLPAAAADAAELVMYRRAGCPYCAAWDQAIGAVYPKTDIGRRLPLRHVDLERKEQRPLALASPIRFTPTFVLAESGREIGRIEGYPGEDFFWGLLERLMLQNGI
jgi:thioredoxin-related protein